MNRTELGEKLKQDLMNTELFKEAVKRFRIFKIDLAGHKLDDVLADYLVYNDTPDEVKVLGYDEDHCRICSECGRLMTEGYCIESGMAYYCSDECLHKNMSEEEFNNLYDDGNGDTYWTSWVD